MNAARAVAAVAIAIAAFGAEACKHGRTSAGDGPKATSDPIRTATQSDASPPTNLPKVDAMTQAKTPAYATAYATPWVDGTRASHAPVPRRPLTSFVKIAAFDAPGDPLAERPLGAVENVIAAPDGEHVVVRGMSAAWIFDTGGKHTGAITIPGAAGYTFATKTGLFHQTREYDWAGKEGNREVWMVEAKPARAWAVHLDGTLASVVNESPVTGNHGSRRRERLDVVVGHVVTGALTTAQVIGVDKIEAVYGMGAIARSGEIAVMTTAKELRVYAPRAAVAKYELTKLHGSHVAFEPYDLSIVDQTICALEAIGREAVDEDEWKGPYQIGTDVAYRWDAIAGGGGWETRLHLVSLAGKDEGTVTVPFEVLEPPVDGGGGRIYLAGTGFAAVQDGKVLWSQKKQPRTLVTSFEGGEVALVVGGTFRIVDRDGNVHETFTVGPGESIASAPAIGPDGSVWMATQKGLYVAR